MSSGTLNPTSVDRLATQLCDARKTGIPLPASDAAGMPTTDADAYRVQDAVTAKLGRKIAAWKVGAASPAATPNGAPIYDVYRATDTIAHAGSTGLELEIAFVLNRAFSASDKAPTRAEVEAAIGAAHIAVETCASRLAEGMGAAPLLRLADNGINHGLVLGPRVDGWRTIDAKTLVARIEANGQAIAEVTGGHTAPDLVGLLTWLVGHAVTTRGGVPAGTVVTTGSWSGIKFVEGPATVRGAFDGLGSIALRLS